MLQKILIFLLLVVLMSSCLKDETTDYSAIDKQTIENYLSSKSLTAQSTSSGLYFIITSPGGTSHPTINSSVTAYYNGYLTDGTVFDHTTNGNPATFPLSGVITGWQEGLQKIGVGGKIKLLIPSALGYGSYAKGTIPANSVLIFDVELIGFTK